MFIHAWYMATLYSHIASGVERSLLIRCVALYTLVSVWMRGEIEKHTRTLASLASLGRVGRGVAWRGDGHGRTTCV
jgi:hypothetical protein